jgi:8-oxo-dGTP pyrophosphatase MutT (NUDIX family)
MRTWRTETARTVLDHPVLRVEKVRRSAGGPAHEFLLLTSPDWVNVVPVTDDGLVVLIRQWRHGVGGPTLEIPGGLVDPGESPAAAAARELAEETGYAAGELEDLGWVHPNPALFGNRCHTFLASGCRLAGPARPEDTEEIEVEPTPLARVPELIHSGRITHSLVVAAFARLWLAREALAPGAHSL